MNITSLFSSEIPLLFPIGHAFSKEASRAAFNEVAFQKYWGGLLDLSLGEIYVVRKDSKTVVAALGVVFTPDMFSGVLTAAEVFWYVLPEFRKGGAGLVLLDHFEKSARERKCQEILMVHFAHLGAGLQKLYESRGYTLLEQTFRKES
jgi:GNAT superfamily N-acetyltransferase